MEIPITGSYQEDDAAVAARLAMIVRKPILYRIGRYFFNLAAPCLGLTALQLFHWKIAPSWLTVAVPLLALGFAFRCLAALSLKKRIPVGSLVAGTLGQGGYEPGDPESAIAWQHAVGFAWNPSVVLIFRTKHDFLALPRSFFANQQDWEAFLSFASANLEDLHQPLLRSTTTKVLAVIVILVAIMLVFKYIMLSAAHP